MAHRSTGTFRTLHALRIKGFATADTLADMTGSPTSDVEAHLARWSAEEQVQFREASALWQLTPTGRARHLELLREDVAPVVPNPDLTAAYQQFLALNEHFKELCGAWQLFKFNGERNDHSDAGYDAAVLENLAHLHAAAEPAIALFGNVVDRMAPYGPRLESVLVRIQDGESNMFTGVMCGSYHDVWMELHEDLMLTQGIDRAREGSF
jgi:hypothetical protein